MAVTSGLRTTASALVLLLVVSACSGGTDANIGADVPGPTASAASKGGPAAVISDGRCAANQAAGTITYITGYQYQSSAGILEAVAADALGYFEDLCLDVKIQPGTGDTAGNAQLVAAGTAQVTSLGSESEALKAVSNGIDVRSVLTWGHVPIATLMTMPEITDLADLEGKVLGHKGALPPPLRAMLVKEGVDVGAIELVQVGYDPSVLPRGQVAALTGYKSNEPILLQAMGVDVTLWNPEDYGIVGSFGNIAVNPDFASEHPTAIEDYLRALIHAFSYCTDNGAECVGFAADLAETGYDQEHNLKIWEVESALVLDNTPDGVPLGYMDVASTEAEGQMLLDSGELESLPDVSDVIDPTFLEAIYEGDQLIWPAP